MPKTIKQYEKIIKKEHEERTKQVPLSSEKFNFSYFF